MKSPYFSIWKEAALEHFDKNASVYAFSRSFPVENLLPNTKILRSLLTPHKKQDEFHKEMYELKIHHCLDGGPIIK